VNIPPSNDHLLADNKTLRAELGISLLQELQLRRQLDRERQELRLQVVSVRKALREAKVVMAT
jgi:hypothetical protein